jgi:hypothetical protein
MMYVSVNLQLTELRLELESLYQRDTGSYQLTSLLIEPYRMMNYFSAICVKVYKSDIAPGVMEHGHEETTSATCMLARMIGMLRHIFR